ncbi:hypothetical protein FDZ74_06365, partial [bacterium]
MKLISRRISFMVVLLLLLSVAGQAAAQTQSVSVAWGQPVRLTDPKIQSWSPTIIADAAGNVHLMWSQTMMTGSPAGMGDTLYYTRWDGEKWTTPSDVRVSSNN